VSPHTEAARLRLHEAAARIAALPLIPTCVAEAASDLLIDGATLDASAEAMLNLALAAEDAVAAAKADMVAAQERKQRAEAAEEAARAALVALLEETGMPAVTARYHTATLSEASAKVVITDEAALPDEFIRVKREPDKTKLRDALRGKRVIPGAALSNGGTALRITKSRKEVAA